jgi:hypothetical protein
LLPLDVIHDYLLGDGLLRGYTSCSSMSSSVALTGGLRPCTGSDLKEQECGLLLSCGRFYTYLGCGRFFGENWFLRLQYSSKQMFPMRNPRSKMNEIFILP